MLEPRTVSKAILAAANSPHLEIIVPFYVRAGVWFKHTLPYAVNPKTIEQDAKSIKRPPFTDAYLDRISDPE